MLGDRPAGPALELPPLTPAIEETLEVFFDLVNGKCRFLAGMLRICLYFWMEDVICHRLANTYTLVASYVSCQRCLTRSVTARDSLLAESSKRPACARVA